MKVSHSPYLARLRIASANIRTESAPPSEWPTSTSLVELADESFAFFPEERWILLGEEELEAERLL